MTCPSRLTSWQVTMPVPERRLTDIGQPSAGRRRRDEDRPHRLAAETRVRKPGQRKPVATRPGTRWRHPGPSRPQPTRRRPARWPRRPASGGRGRTGHSPSQRPRPRLPSARPRRWHGEAEPFQHPGLEPRRRLPGGQQPQQFLARRRQPADAPPARRTALQVRQRLRPLTPRQDPERQLLSHASEPGASHLTQLATAYLPGDRRPAIPARPSQVRASAAPRGTPSAP